MGGNSDSERIQGPYRLETSFSAVYQEPNGASWLGLSRSAGTVETALISQDTAEKPNSTWMPVLLPSQTHTRFGEACISPCSQGLLTCASNHHSGRPKKALMLVSCIWSHGQLPRIETRENSSISKILLNSNCHLDLCLVEAVGSPISHSGDQLTLK